MKKLAILVFCAVAVMLSSGVFAQQTPIGTIPIVGGIIRGIDLEKGAVTVGPPQEPVDRVAPTITFFVTNQTKILKNGQPALLENLAVGDFCKAEVRKTPEGALVALAVRAETPRPPLQWVRGTIAKISYADSVFALKVIRPDTNAEMIITFVIDRGTKIMKDGKEACLGDLYVGDIAEVGHAPITVAVIDQPIRAAAVHARTPPELIARVSGRIARLDAEKKIVWIAPFNVKCENAEKCLVPVRVVRLTRIEKLGSAVFEDLSVGDRANVTFRKDPAGEMPIALTIAVMPESFEGRIAEVAYERNIVIVQRGEVRMKFEVDRLTRIFKNGRPATIKDLKTGDKAGIAYFKFDDVNVASVIKAAGIVAPITR